MSTKAAIVKGVGAHGLWKQRLLDAIKTGSSEWTPDVVCQDNQCEFGKWLYSCPAPVKSSPHFESVKELHAKFHKVAANVLELALSGKKSEAENAVKPGSAYMEASGALTKKMMTWKADES
jgi:hypothetical protein